MIKDIVNRIQTAWRSLPSITRTILLVTYDFMVCEWLVFSGVLLYVIYSKNRLIFWSLLAATLVVSVAVVVRNLMWVYKSNAQAEYIAKLQNENERNILLMTQILTAMKGRIVSAPQCVEQDANLPNDFSKMD